MSTSTFWIGAGVNSNFNTPYVCDYYTVPKGITHQATFSLDIRGKQPNGTTNEGYITNPTGYQRTSNFYLCNSAGNNAVLIGSITLNGGGSKTSGGPSGTFNLRGLMGSKLYIKCNDANGNTNGVKMRGDCAFTISTTQATKVVAGNPIRYTDRTQIGVATTQYATISDSHFSSGTKAEASTFNTSVLGY